MQSTDRSFGVQKVGLVPLHSQVDKLTSTILLKIHMKNQLYPYTAVRRYIYVLGTPPNMKKTQLTIFPDVDGTTHMGHIHSA